jgi:hypothetical protein
MIRSFYLVHAQWRFRTCPCQKVHAQKIDLRVVFATETESIAKERRGLKPTWARVQRTQVIVCVHGVEQAFTPKCLRYAASCKRL